MSHFNLSDLSDLSDLEDLSGGFRSAEELSGGTCDMDEFDSKRARELAERVKAMAPSAPGNVETPVGRKLLIDSMAISGGKTGKKVGPEKYGDKAEDMLLGTVRRTPFDNRQWHVGLGFINGRWKKQWFPTTFKFARTPLGCDFSCDNYCFGPQDPCPLTIPSCCKERYEYLPCWGKKPGNAASTAAPAPASTAAPPANTSIPATTAKTPTAYDPTGMAVEGGMHHAAMEKATSLRRQIRGAVDPRVQLLVNRLQPIFERVKANRGVRCHELCKMAKKAYDHYAANIRNVMNLPPLQKDYGHTMLVAASHAMQHYFRQRKFNDCDFCHKLVQKLQHR